MAKRANIIFSIVSTPNDLHEIFFGKKGIHKSAKPGTIFIDMTTSSSKLAQKRHEASKKNDFHSLDAPVSGGPFGTKEGTLAIMVGGRKKIYDKVKDLIYKMGSFVKHMGKAGFGQKAKLYNQILISGSMAGLIETLIFASKMGLNQLDIMEILNNGVSASPMVNNQGAKIAQKDSSPEISTENFIKNMNLIVDEAHFNNTVLPITSFVGQLYSATKNFNMNHIGSVIVVCII